MPDMRRPTITVRYNGLFDFDGLYAAVVDWSKHYGYKWYEKTYKHKVPTPYGAEQELEWIIETKITHYLKYEIALKVHTYHQREVEVDIDGKKKYLTNARIYITLNGRMIYDWQNRFVGGRMVHKLGEWYKSIIYKKDVESLYYDQLYYRIWNLQALLKKYFEMQTQKYAYKHYLREH